MFTKLYDKILYLWAKMEVYNFHAMNEYLDYKADVEWIKKNRE